MFFNENEEAVGWMGVCFECLLEIDGQPNQQSCLIPVKEGMRVRRQTPDPKEYA